MDICGCAGRATALQDGARGCLGREGPILVAPAACASVIGPRPAPSMYQRILRPCRHHPSTYVSVACGTRCVLSCRGMLGGWHHIRKKRYWMLVGQNRAASDQPAARPSWRSAQAAGSLCSDPQARSKAGGRVCRHVVVRSAGAESRAKRPGPITACDQGPTDREFDQHE